MKKEWLVVGLVALTSVSVLTACGKSETKSEPKQEATSKTKEKTEKSSTKETSTTETTSSSSSSSEKETTTSSSSGFSSKNYADTKVMEFAVNGKVYKLGETTLQTLIDDGVPFDEKSLNNIGNNVNPNSQSATFNVVMSDYWNLQISVANFTDNPAAAKDLPVSYLYFPAKRDKTQNVVTFNFPWELTIDSLKANAGEPTDLQHSDGDNGYASDVLEYQYESSAYYTEGGYRFEFINGEFRYLTMTYVPQ